MEVKQGNFIYLKFSFYAGVELISSVVLVSGIQQSHSSSNSFPMYFITEDRAEFPVPYSTSSLVIYLIYSSVCMSVPNSQLIPPLESKSVLNQNLILFHLI